MIRCFIKNVQLIVFVELQIKYLPLDWIIETKLKLIDSDLSTLESHKPGDFNKKP